LRIRLGTRGSALALAQSESFARKLRAAGHEVEVVRIMTEGDVRPQDTQLDTPPGEGIFVAAIARALVRGEVDAAVHSAKDLTGEMPPGLVVAALLERDDPRDAVCGPFAALDEIPDGARVGTSSARRGGLLRELRPGLEIVPLRGNVDTRLRKLDAGEADAIVLAAAGLRRLGLAERIAFLLDPTVFVPEAGQGAIAVQVREGDEALVSALDHAPTRRAVEAERAFARSVGGGCNVPVAAYAWDGDGGLELRTWVAG
jgi:hydroxymethylbilane synthase